MKILQQAKCAPIAQLKLLNHRSNLYCTDTKKEAPADNESGGRVKLIFTLTSSISSLTPHFWPSVSLTPPAYHALFLPHLPGHY